MSRLQQLQWCLQPWRKVVFGLDFFASINVKELYDIIQTLIESIEGLNRLHGVVEVNNMIETVRDVTLQYEEISGMQWLNIANLEKVIHMAKVLQNTAQVLVHKADGDAQEECNTVYELASELSSQIQTKINELWRNEADRRESLRENREQFLRWQEAMREVRERDRTSANSENRDPRNNGMQ